MKKFVRPAAIIILIVAPLAAFFITCAWLLAPESNLVGRSLEKYLARNSGLKVSVSSSKISYSFPGMLSIALVGLEIKDDHENPIFTADTVVLSPSLRGLLRRELIIESISIANFWTLITRDEHGEISVPLGSAFKPLALDLDKETNQQTKNHGLDPGGEVEGHSFEMVGWKVQTIDYTNGQVDWIDRKGNPDNPTIVNLSEIQGVFSHSKVDQRVSFELKSTLTDKLDYSTHVSLKGVIDVDWSVPSVQSAKFSVFYKSQQLGVFSDYLSYMPGVTEIKTWELSCQLILEEPRIMALSLDATLVGGEAKDQELKLSTNGTIKDPFLDSTYFDLTTQVVSNSKWLESIFISDKDGFKVIGPLAFKAKIKGNLDSLNIDTEIDCEKTYVSLRSTFLQCSIKPNKALLNFNTRRIGQRDFAFDGSGTFHFNIKDRELGRGDSPENLHMEGEAPTRVKFSGNGSRFDWSFISNLTNLFMSSTNGFRKQIGKKSSLEALGSYSASGLLVQKALFVTPGLSLKAGRTLLDANRRFGRLVLDLEIENLSATFPQNVSITKLGVSGGGKASLIVRNLQSRFIESGRIHLLDVHCKPDQATWNLHNVSGVLELKANTLTISVLTGAVAGYVKAPFKVTGSLKDIGSYSTTNGTVYLKVDRGKIKSDVIVQILTEAHSILGSMVKPRPLAMSGDFIHFDQVNADIQVNSGRATTHNLQMRGNEIISSAIGSIQLDSLKLDATMGIYTKVVGSDTLEAVPLIGELMQRHRDRLLRIPVTVFARLSGPILSQIDVKPVHEQQLDKPTLERLKALIRVDD
ncbi:MAG: hypothetical protein V1897_06165 [Pseudomonadota bacterium]